MNSKDIIDVTDSDFEFEVINYSLNTPVVVDFWAEWCIPCKTLEPILKKLVNEAGGGFRLARVNVDQNPNLVMRYGVRSIPAVKAFSQAELVAEFSSLQSEQRIRDFLSKIIPPSPLTLAIEKGNSLIEFYDWKNAEAVYKDVLSKQPEQPEALLGLAKIYLATQNPHDAYLILSDFPESRQYAKAEILLPLARALMDYEKDMLPQESDLDIFFYNCLRLVERQNIQAALDGLLEIIKEDRGYASGLAKDVFLALLQLLGENSQHTRRYRSELASALF
jgi:putative thioredoxin